MANINSKIITLAIFSPQWYLVVIISFDACLDRDFIDRSRYCGATTVWQSIFRALVACTFRARVLAILPTYC